MTRSSMLKPPQLLRALAFILALSPVLAAALDVGQTPPDFSAKTLDGKPISLSSLRGKVVLIDFWASWCAPCKVEMPVLERLHKKLAARGLVIVGVSVDNERDNAQKFIQGLKVSFPIVHDEKHVVADQYKPPRMPTSVIIDRAGKIRHVHAGFHEDDAAKIEQEIGKLLE